MMRKIRHAELAIGQTLAFDCYDAQENFLLRRGQVISSEKQIEFLIARGFFKNLPAGVKRPSTPPANEAPKEKTPFGILEYCKDQVRALFNKIRIDRGARQPGVNNFDTLKKSYRETIRNIDGNKTADFQGQILNVCKGIQDMCRDDQDAAIGSVHLDPLCRYTTVQPLHKAILSEILASRLGVSQQERLSILAAALTANISILDLQELLHTQAAPLSESQQKMIKLHPLPSIEMLLELGVSDDMWIQTILHHHERFDGSGYHCGLKGSAISQGAQILSLADTYSAMLKPHAHRNAARAKEILQKMFMNRGAVFAEELVQAFIKELGIYPPGSMVKLQNGELAIVTRRSPSPSAPKVKSILNALGMPMTTSVSRDTTMGPFAICAGIPRSRIQKVNYHALWDYMAAA